MKQHFHRSFAFVILVTTIFISSSKAQAVDATTMTNKVMAGYQGWFRTPGDRSENRGWAHLFNSATPDPAKLAIDTWPDLSEYSKDEKYAVPGFTYPDGSQAYLYSAQNYKTVLRHFQWMKQYGIDGVWLSEFCSHFPGARQQNDTTAMLRVMDNVRRAATATGRTWAFMYDMSGLTPANTYSVILNQWRKMVDEGVTSDPRYMHHHGKPVLLLWGFFPGRPASQPEFCKSLIDFLQSPGKYQATLVGGGDPNWRAQGTPEFQAMLMSMSGWQPWTVGRVAKDPATGYKVSRTDLWAGDIAKCKENNVLFMPVINSGTHVAGPPPAAPVLPVVPRRNGNFLWEQFVAASKAGGINSVFIAMFDEVNEGTQILKVTNHPPTQAPFLTYEGSTNDYYLKLVGLGESLLKQGTPISPVIPVSPFDPGKSYKLKNRASGLLLDNSAKATAAGASDWQLTYDGAGFFKIKDQAGANVLSGSIDGKVSVTNDTQSDNQKWHLEWDGTGSCRIINKKTGLAVAFKGDGTPVAGAVDSAADDLRWTVIEQ